MHRAHAGAVLGLAILLLAGCGLPSLPPPAVTSTALSSRQGLLTPVAPLATATGTADATATPRIGATNGSEPAATLAPTSSAVETATPGAVDEVALARQVDAERLMADVRWLADDARKGRLIGSPEEDVVGAWLAERFESLNLQPFAGVGLHDYLQPFEVPAMLIPGRGGDSGQARGENILAVLPGSARPHSYVYISAHYDGLGVCRGGQVCNGADDDATGVAAVLEAARIMSSAATAPEETIVFVAFSGEEIGLWGSRALCDLLATTGGGTPGLMLNLEVLGALEGFGNRVDVWDESEPSTEPLVAAVEQAGQDLGFPVDRLGRDPGSDALSLLRCGVPAVSVDVAWDQQGHAAMHTPDDDPERIDVDGLYRAVQVIVAAAWRLANDGQ